MISCHTYPQGVLHRTNRDFVAALLLIVFTMCAVAYGQDPLYKSKSYAVLPDRVVEGPFSAQAVSPNEIVTNYPVSTNSTTSQRSWKVTGDISRYPQLQSSVPLTDALYNLSLDELRQDTRSDGALNAGAQWQGVWTRDVSYSILLSLAAIDPEASKKSLTMKVKRDRIVQDTGTGGSWPISTDRVTWALAAWEIYLVQGDRSWLQWSYQIIANSIRDDESVVIDPRTGLARGESSFMDWREQTYPRWMQPADIYNSECLGTNAVYFRTYQILAAMARELGLPSHQWSQKADAIKSAINRYLWMDQLGYYGEYRYGREYPVLLPRADALGESLAVLFDIADPARQDKIIRSTPVMEYGIPTVYPQTPGIPPYHNRSVWPFVQAYWTLAAAKRLDSSATLQGFASIYRASALFGTNKENFVLDTGNPAGTQINSDRQLWSVAGNLATVYRVLFGMRFALDGLHFNPVIPASLAGTRTLSNFHYRGATLSIEVRGHGDAIKRLTLDGSVARQVVPANLTGSHNVVIEMQERAPRETVNRIVNYLEAPDTPQVRYEHDSISWAAVDKAARYRVYRNGKETEITTSTSVSVNTEHDLTQYQVAAINENGVESFLSEPVNVNEAPFIIAAVGDSAAPDPASFAALDQKQNPNLIVTGKLPTSGNFSIAVYYSNGSGPINTDNKCAIRTLFIDGKQIGPVVFPQRGKDEWNKWGWSNSLQVSLTSGTHKFELRLQPENLNMNGEVNDVHVASLALFPIE